VTLSELVTKADRSLGQKALKTPASPAICRIALHCIRRIKTGLFIVMVYIRGLPDAYVPSTLAVQEAEQLYQPGYKTLME